MPATRLRFELFFAVGWIAFGALALPLLVYGVGTLLLGNYADGGVGAFYANLYRDLLGGSLAPAGLILGPYVILMLARLPLLGRRRAPRSAAHEADDEPEPAARQRRIEPRIGS